MSSITSHLRLLAVSAALWLAASHTHAQESAVPAAPVAHVAQYALSIERFAGIGFSSGRSDAAHGGVDFTGFVLGGPQANPLGAPRLGFDFIAANNFLIGATLGFTTQSLTIKAEGSSDRPALGLWTLLLGVRGGYRVQLGPHVDLIPRLGLTLLTGTLTVSGRSCSVTFDSATGVSTSEVCSTRPGPSGTVFGGMSTLDLVGRFRFTPGFFFDAGVTYDQVLFASLSTEEPRGTGMATKTDQPASGMYFNLQLWAGLGGYL